MGNGPVFVWAQEAIEGAKREGLPVIALETVEGCPHIHHFTFPPQGCAVSTQAFLLSPPLVSMLLVFHSARAFFSSLKMQLRRVSADDGRRCWVRACVLAAAARQRAPRRACQPPRALRSRRAGISLAACQPWSALLRAAAVSRRGTAWRRRTMACQEAGWHVQTRARGCVCVSSCASVCLTN